LDKNDTQSFTEQIFIEDLLGAQHCSRLFGEGALNKTKSLLSFMGSLFQHRHSINRQIIMAEETNYG
jgi:hypothetical protein